jgi:hypothetical protein
MALGALHLGQGLDQVALCHLDRSAKYLAVAASLIVCQSAYLPVGYAWASETSFGAGKHGVSSQNPRQGWGGRDGQGPSRPETDAEEIDPGNCLALGVPPLNRPEV